jgi:hypothetical protein
MTLPQKIYLHKMHKRINVTAVRFFFSNSFIPL